ncbi:MAG: leucine-rich repeat protein [Clostridiales bacterium]|nr:leucine-rich repeat protein [Clostridiales bacterium]
MILKILSGIMTMIILLAAAGQAALAPRTDLVSDAAPKLESADFSEIDYMAYDGSHIKVSVEGPDFCVDSENVSDFTLQLFSPQYQQSKASKTYHDKSFACDFTSKMKKNVLYGIMLNYVMDDIVFSLHSNFVFLDKSGDIHFYKTPCYRFNLDRISELSTDKDSMSEYLVSQNDVECDNICMISYSNQICEGLTDDRQKVFAIYAYVTQRMAYDSVQVNDNRAYQDDALLVMRRGIAVCEGFANAFTALCRAQGIPATVEYGLGLSSYKDMMESDLENDEIPDHAWAAVFLDGQWLYVDPTFDIVNYYEGYGIQSTGSRNSTYFSYFLSPLEAFSFEHKICDADTVHGYERSGYCGDNATYTVSRDGTLTIKGSGEIRMPYGVNDYSKIVFDPDSNITSIGKNCFQDCDLLTSVILPDTVKSIEDGAFSTCEDLEYVYIPDSVTYIGNSAFYTCDELAYVRVPDNIEHIGKDAFDRCPRLILSVPSHMKKVAKGYSVDPYYVDVR